MTRFRDRLRSALPYLVAALGGAGVILLNSNWDSAVLYTLVFWESPFAVPVLSSAGGVAVLAAINEFRLRRFRKEVGAHLFFALSQNAQTAAAVNGIAQALVAKGILGERIDGPVPPCTNHGNGSSGATVH